MATAIAEVLEIQWRGRAGNAAWIACPPTSIPSAGQYLMAWSPDAVDSPLATVLFQEAASPEGFLAVPPIPSTWQPGARLFLRGPLGRGFNMPSHVRRLALASLGGNACYLLPLAHQALAMNAAVALFAEEVLPGLSAAIEVISCRELPEALTWADWLAIVLPLEQLAALPERLGIPGDQQSIPNPGQALVLTSMPCGAIADCGACAVFTRRGWKLACDDGPVFDLVDLL